MTLTNPPSSLCDVRSWLYGVKDEVNTLSNQTSVLETTHPQNQVLASPNGSTGLLSVRALVSNDIPSLDASKIGSGTFADARIPNLDASKTTTGTFDNARINWASPSAIGSTTPAQGTFTKVNITGSSAASTTGDISYESTEDNLTTRVNGSETYYLSMEKARYYATRTVSNTIVETTLLPATLFGSATFAANTIVAGRRVRVYLEGEIGSNNTTDTVTFRFKLGSVTFSTSTAYARAVTVTRPLKIECVFTCLTAGAGGTFSSYNNFLDMTNNPATINWASQSGAVVSTTGSNAVAITAQWSAASPNNAINIYSGIIEVY